MWNIPVLSVAQIVNHGSNVIFLPQGSYIEYTKEPSNNDMGFDLNEDVGSPT